MKLEEVSSRTLPPIPNKPGVSNWVQKAGGLPSFIERIARHLQAKGMTTSRAIATAVSQSKKVCATGLTFGGRTKVSADARARYCKAVAEWEAKKAKTKAKKAVEVLAEMEAIEKLGRENVLTEEQAEGLADSVMEFLYGAVEEVGVEVFVEATHEEEDTFAEEVAECDAIVEVFRVTYDESKHKRAPKGSSGGGQFITKGSSDKGTRAAQKILGMKPDGEFSDKAVERVKSFQKKHGLVVDGKIGRQTAHAMLGGKKKISVGSITDKQRTKLVRQAFK